MFYNRSEKGLLSLGQDSLLASWTSWDDKLRQKISSSCSSSGSGYSSSNVAHSGKTHWTKKWTCPNLFLANNYVANINVNTEE